MTVTLSDITCNETIQAMIKKGQYWHNISPQYGSKHKVLIYICRHFVAHFKVLSAKQSTTGNVVFIEFWSCKSEINIIYISCSFLLFVYHC